MTRTHIRSSARLLTLAALVGLAGLAPVAIASGSDDFPPGTVLPAADQVIGFQAAASTTTGTFPGAVITRVKFELENGQIVYRTEGVHPMRRARVRQDINPITGAILRSRSQTINVREARDAATIGQAMNTFTVNFSQAAQIAVQSRGAGQATDVRVDGTSRGLTYKVTVLNGATKAEVRINPVTDLWRQLRIMKQDRDLWRACWGNTGFYFISALVMMNVVVFGKSVLNLTGTQNSMLNVWLALGIGFGSVVAGYASRGHIEYRLVPIGALGLALSTVPMGMEGVTADTFRICMATLGFSAGLFIVPVVSVIQHRPSPESKGAVQGAVSSLSFIGIMAAAGVQWVSRETFHITSGQVFWVCGASAIICGAYAAISRGRFIKAE